MLFFRYLRRVFPEIIVSFSLSLICVGLGILNPSLTFLILYVANLALAVLPIFAVTLLIMETIYRRLSGRMFTRQQKSLTMALAVILVTTIGFVAFPHVYLFISAFPFNFTLPLISLNSFFLSFESLVNFSRANRRFNHNFSLLMMMFSSTSRWTVYQALVENYEMDLPMEQAPVQRQNNNTRHAPNNEGIDDSRNHVPADPADITRNLKMLSQKEVQALVKRQKSLVAQLPKEAIIDDRNLYKIHIFRLHERSETTLTDEDVLLAKKGAEEEAAKLEKQYIETIVGDSHVTAGQKIKAYQDYREIARTISSAYAACPVSLEAVNTSKSKFFLVEKSYYDTTTNSLYGVPTAKPSVIETESFTGLLGASTPKNPLTQDPYSNPERYPNPLKPGESKYNRQTKQQDRYDARKGPSFPTYYRYHPYVEVAGHGLSLQLCDAIEEFLNPALVPRRLPGLNVPQKPSAKSATSDPKKYRKTPSVAPSSIASQNMFRRESDGNLVALDLTQEEYEQARAAQELHDNRIPTF